MSNRRTFLKQLSGTIAFASLAGLPLDVLAKREQIKISILHTNDMHSRIEPFPDDDVKWAGLGGMARRAAIIDQFRAKEKNVLLLDAGDIFQGTPYFNYYGGELEYKLMSRMGYDAVTIGNHDFDNGIDGLVKMHPHANFPFLIANYDFSDTAMNGKTQPYKIFEKEGIRIGVFGIGIELAGLVEKKMYGETRYLDPLKKADEMSTLLRLEKKCDLVICLSHLGYKYKENKLSDELFAQASENIDLIIGGHTHTFLDQPVAYKNKSGRQVLVAQAGWAGIKLGKIDFFFERKSGLFAANTKYQIETASSLIKVSELTTGLG